MVNKLDHKLDSLRQYLSNIPELELAVLIGSRATNKDHKHSDWDIAVRWHQRDDIDIINLLARPETLRRALAQHLKLSIEKIDLIDFTNSGLTMRAVIAEEGIVLKGAESLAWHYFLQRTWRDLEDYYWDQCYAV